MNAHVATGFCNGVQKPILFFTFRALYQSNDSILMRTVRKFRISRNLRVLIDCKAKKVSYFKIQTFNPTIINGIGDLPFRSRCRAKMQLVSELVFGSCKMHEFYAIKLHTVMMDGKTRWNTKSFINKNFVENRGI